MKIEARTLFMAALLMLSAYMLINKLLLPSTVQIMVQNGETTVKEIPNLYTITDSLIIAVSSFLLGISSYYLLVFKSEVGQKKGENIQEKGMAIKENSLNSDKYRTGKNTAENLLNILKGNEHKIIKELLEGEEMTQSELAVRTGIPKSTLSRTLHELERRNLIVRYENGMSKMVKLMQNHLELIK